jgi:hypothetical protein
MPSILDIAPPELSAKEVEIRGVKFTLCGIPAIDWATLYARFPVLRAVAAGVTDGVTASPVIVHAMNAAVIAAGVGQLGNPDVERVASANLTRDEMESLVSEVFRLSAPGAMLGPLLDGEPYSSAPLPNGDVGQNAVLDTNSPRLSSH